MYQDPDGLMRLLLLGIWTPLFVLGLAYFAYRFLVERASRALTYDRESRARERDTEIVFRLQRLTATLDEFTSRTKDASSFNERYMESIQDRLSQRLDSIIRTTQDNMHSHIAHVESTLKSELADTRNYIQEMPMSSSLPPLSSTALREMIEQALERALPPRLSSFSVHSEKNLTPIRSEIIPAQKKGSANEDRGNVVREISHALFTPLSRIAAISSNVVSQEVSPEIKLKMQRARSSVEICYAYLAAYRGLVNIAATTTYWNPASLKAALAASAEVYLEQHSLSADVQVSAPDDIPGLTNFYVLACVLPLLENAIEASQDGDVISIELEHQSSLALGRITNKLHDRFPGDDIFNANFTTKRSGSSDEGPSKHEGLGLTVVKSLLSNLSGSKLTYKLHDGFITFVLQLPAKAA